MQPIADDSRLFHDCDPMAVMGARAMGMVVIAVALLH